MHIEICHLLEACNPFVLIRANEIFSMYKTLTKSSKNATAGPSGVAISSGRFLNFTFTDP